MGRTTEVLVPSMPSNHNGDNGRVFTKQPQPGASKKQPNASQDSYLHASYSFDVAPSGEYPATGFRVVSIPEPSTSVASIPEPSTLILLATGAVGLFLIARKELRHAA